LGRRMQLRINGRERVTYFRTYIAEKMNVRPEHQRFVFSGKLIGNDELRSYGIRDGSMIEIIPEPMFVRGKRGFADVYILCFA